MHQYTDANGNPREIRINVGTMSRVQSVLKLNLYKLVDDGARGLAELLQDLPGLVNVLYILTGADKAGIPEETFAESFDGDTLEAASEAFVEELLFFIPNRRARETLRAMLTKGRQLGAKLLDRADASLASMDPEKMAAEIEERLKAAASTEPALSGSSGSSPASSASTPILSP